MLKANDVIIVMFLRLVLGLCFSTHVMTETLNAVASPGQRSSLLRVIYPKWVPDFKLSECDERAVCSRIDTYSEPWVERLCSCKNGHVCSSSLQPDDGYTLLEKSRQYKLCEPVDSLPTCRFFRDVTWSYVATTNHTKQLVHCRCPTNSAPYFLKHEQELTADGRTVFKIHFACSPQSILRCRWKEPCRLFSIRKRFPVQEVTTSTLCQCSSKTSCPVHHTEPFVIASESKSNADGTRTYIGYCGIPSSKAKEK